MNQCYYNGDFYQCATATSAGESPATAAAKWRKIKLPSKWRWALAQLTYANLLVIDGQNDKATIESSKAYGRDRVGVDELLRQEANEESREVTRARGANVNSGRTRPVKASVILNDAYRLIGWDSSQLDDRDQADAFASFSKALQELWEAWWWHELMICQQQALAESRENYVAYTAGQALYEASADAYYISLDAQACPPLPSATYRWETYDPNHLAAADWDAAQTYSAGDQVTYGGQEYQCWLVAAAGTLPTDTSYFLPLSGWQPVVPYTAAQFGSLAGASVGPFGPVRAVSKYDPRTAPNPVFYELNVTESGTRILKLDVTHPWIWSRRVTPIIADDTTDYSATATYDATDPEDLVYDS